MLSKEDNDLLCRVGPGTPTGALLREYWIPALLSSELPERDGPPERVRLLGEDLVAFRDSQNRVGMLANNCPHRGASLFFGRNEESGLRCVYHGWKFDVSGACVDMPNEPGWPFPEPVEGRAADFDGAQPTPPHKIHHTAYPCTERGGIIWTYMGSRPTLPPIPDLEPNMLPEGRCQVNKVMRECNWFQGLEGDIDTSHLAFLHLGKMKPEDTVEGSFDYYTVKDRAPRFAALDTEFGTSYGGWRPATDDTYYWRLAHFLFPFYTMIPTGVLGKQVMVRAWVPMDDEHLMFWMIYDPGTRVVSGAGSGTGSGAAGTAPGFSYAPSTSSAHGKWRLVQNRDNDYFIDREAQRTTSYTGIEGIHSQDQAITESMGRIYDRTHEHLGTSDVMVIRTRRRVINAARALRDQGLTPPGVDDPTVYRIRSGGVILPRNADWLEATKDLRKAPVAS